MQRAARRGASREPPSGGNARRRSSVAQTKSTLAVTKARYAKAMDDARRQAAINLAVIEPPFHLSGWTRRALEAYRDQWCAPGVDRPHPEGGWDWPEMFRRHRDFDTMPVAIWTGEHRLGGLGLVRATNAAVVCDFIEGDRRSDCPLRGRRALIILEAAFCYAQTLPRQEVRLVPANERLAELYRDVYGFTLEQPRKGAPYYVRKV